MKSIDIKSFKVKDNLCQDIWHDKSLSMEVAARLKKIAFDFLDSIDIPRNLLKDILFTGSLANYNWSNYSDIDLHILLDFTDIDENVDLVKQFFDSKRLEWNKTHNIKIKGHEVEIYVQQTDEPHHSTGIYSIMGNEWIIEPSKENVDINEEEVEKKAKNIMLEIDEVSRLLKSKDYGGAYHYASKLKERIRSFRSCGLEEGGEFSVENIAFKSLRRNGYLELLSYLKTNAYDALMSLDEATGVTVKEGWLADDPSGWQNLRNKIIDEYPGVEMSAVFDPNNKTLKIYKIALSKNLRGQGFGSEIMDKIADWADGIQATIVLSPSKDFGASSVERLITFYKRFGFVQNSGRHKDYTISDMMYRKPQ